MATNGKLTLPNRPDCIEVVTALERILASPAFTRSPRLSSFLRFVVDQRLSGREESPKEYEIGVQVFERGAGYDPRIDPIVRVQARQLRFKLGEYYQTLGSAERIRIDLPKGSYLPALATVDSAVGPAEAAPLSPAQPRDSQPAPRPERWLSQRALTAALGVVALAVLALYAIGAGRPARDASPSVAVLPFANLSPDPANQYFSDGLTDEITDALSHLKPLRVISRDSAFQFRGRQADIREVGRQLHVANVLVGSVERYGDRVKVVARLERASDGSSTWSATYERSAADLFAIQSELAAGITGSLKLAVLDRPAARHEPNPEAHDWYLRGLYEAEQIASEPLHRAEADFEHAINLDPEYAAAYLGLANVKYNRGIARGTVATEAEIREAERLYKKAIELDPRMATARANLAMLVMQYDWDWRRAEREIDAALAMGGNSAAESDYAALLTFHGHFPEADEHLRRALDLNPFGTMQLLNTGSIRIMEGRLDPARVAYRQAMARAPEAFGAPICVGITYVMEGRPDLALPLFRRVEEKYPQARVFEAMAAARSGDRQRALALLRPFEEDYQVNGFPVQWFAWVYAFLGDDNNAMLWLERSADRREGHALFFAVNPILRNLHDNPRFLALKKRMGLDR